MVKVNAQYNVAKAGSLPVRVAAYQRKRMFNIFLRRCNLPDPDATILDVGVTSDQTYEASNYLEAWYPHTARITAAGIDDCSFLTDIYPGLTFIRADARALPFKDRSRRRVRRSWVFQACWRADCTEQASWTECADVTCAAS